MARVVVVGSGSGGLATAARLATRRHDVTVVEAGANFGGRLAPIGRSASGAEFSIVESIVTLPAPLRDLFNKTGGALEDAIALQPAPPLQLWLSDDRVTEVPSVDPAAVGSALGQVFGADVAGEYRVLHAAAAELWQQLRRPLLETPGGSPAWLLAEIARNGLGRWGAARLLRPHESFAKSCADIGAADVRAWLDLEALQAGSSPRQLPEWAITRHYIRYVFGEWVVPGGNPALAQVLSDRATERGAALRANAAVEEVRVESGRVAGVELVGGEIIAADWVVVTGDAPMLIDERSTAATSSDISTFVVQLNLAVSDIAASIRTSRRVTVLPRDRAVAHNAMYDDPPLADAWISMEQLDVHDERATWVLRVPMGVGQLDAVATARDICMLLLRRGVITSDESLHIEQVWTPVDVGAVMNSPRGRIAGPAAKGPWRSLVRPPITTSVKGLLRAGGGVSAGPGLPYSVQTGEVVADLIGRPH